MLGIGTPILSFQRELRLTCAEGDYKNPGFASAGGLDHAYQEDVKDVSPEVQAKFKETEHGTAMGATVSGTPYTTSLPPLRCKNPSDSR